MADIRPGDFAAAVRCGNGWALFPAPDAPEPGKFAVAVKAGNAVAAFKANKPEVDQYALAIRQGHHWALAGISHDDDDEEPERLPCFIRNPLCSYIPCAPVIGQGYNVLFSGWGGDLAGVNGQRTFTWQSDCTWTVTDAGFTFYLTYPWAAGPYKWMVHGYRLGDNAVFSVGSPGMGAYEAEANPLEPVYADPRFDVGLDGMGIAVVLAPPMPPLSP